MMGAAMKDRGVDFGTSGGKQMYGKEGKTVWKS